MKGLDYSILAAMIFITCSCSGTLDQDGTTDIELPSRYISFRIGDNSKVSNMIEDMDGRTFGIVGFQYGHATNWDTYKGGTGCVPSATFYNRNVTVDSGVGDYGTPEKWDNASRYTFFGYYPKGNGVSLVGNQSTTGVPSITYTINWTDPYYDIMTAMAKDADNSGDGTVPMHFYHKLFCFDVALRNFTETDVTVNDVSVTFTSSLYHSVTIPLDGSAIIPADPVSNKSFTICSSSDATLVQAGGKLTKVSKDDQNLMFIPQSGAFSGSLMLKKQGIATPYSVEFNFNQTFEPGVRYTLQGSFIDDDTLSLEIIETTHWTDVDQDIKFE